MQTNPEGTWCPPSLQEAAKFVLPVQLPRSKIVCKEIKANTKTNAFCHLPQVSSIFLCIREHSNSPHHIPCSYPKTLLKFTTVLDAHTSVDHKLTQAFPSCVGTQHVREPSLLGAGHSPVDISFVPPRVQQNRPAVLPGVPKPP